MSRDDFLDSMRRARVTLFLPNEEEGFYLPALEGMALGTIVVCPDCVGNRSFCLPGVNAFRPAFRSTTWYWTLRCAHNGGISSGDITRGAIETARAHSFDAERKRFHQVLYHLDALWASS